ncbi:hypothetical protein CAPSP0001_2670 [Capnocytophaga sputigena ATCC 33612]|nr:hypothetical protein CAPSP0001_2670 [Capnocytophaga sputigena ATCC 33612]
MISAYYSTPYETAAKVQNNSEIQNTNDKKLPSINNTWQNL